MRITGSKTILPFSANLRQTTKSYYEQRAREYAYTAGLASPIGLIEEFSSSLRAGSRIVDLGTGAGRHLAIFRERKFDAFGLDYSEALLHVARERVGVPVVLADLQRLPFGDETFDGAWASASLLHLPRDELPIALSEIRRILRPDGMFFSSMKVGSVDGVDAKGRWYTYFGASEWSACVSAAGLKVEKLDCDIEERRANPKSERIMWINCLARRLAATQF